MRARLGRSYAPCPPPGRLPHARPRTAANRYPGAGAARPASASTAATALPSTPRRDMVGRAVEDGLAGGGSCLAGREPAAPVAGLAAAEVGDLNRVVPPAVPRFGQVRAAARELPTGGYVGAAAPLEHDVPECCS